MPVVPDGIYKIISVLYSPPNVDKNDEQVIDLLQDGPGPIGARPASQAHNDQWRIENKYGGPTSNSVLIESVKPPGLYADLKDNIWLVGEPADSFPPTIWTLVDRGSGKYNIQAPDSNLLWELKHPNQLQLGDYQQGTEPYNEWRFQRVSD